MANNQMPHNLEAEAALLGCIIIDGDIQSELLETLKEDDFYQESDRLVFEAMKKVYGARKPVDVVTLTDMLEREGTLERAAGCSALPSLRKSRLRRQITNSILRSSDATPSAAVSSVPPKGSSK